MEACFEGERELAVDMSDTDLGRFLLDEVLTDLHRAEQEFAWNDEGYRHYAHSRGAVREAMYRWLGVKEEYSGVLGPVKERNST